MGVYYPSVMCKFRIRFDEALHGIPAPPPQDPSADARLSSDIGIRTGLFPALIQGKADQLSQIVNVMPVRATVDLAGYRQAGKFSMDVLYRDFPIEPDVVRAIGIELYAGSVDPGQWGTGNTQAPAPGSSFVGFGQSPRLSQVQTSGPIGERNLLIVGLVDKMETEFNEKGFITHLEGRDLVGVMLDLFITPAQLRGLNTNQPIHLVMQQIVNRVPLLSAVLQSSGGALTVKTQADEWPGGVIPAPGVAGDWTRINLGAMAQTNPQHPQTAPQMLPTGNVNRLRVWDVITQECGLVGAVPYFSGRQLCVRPAVALYDPHKPTFDPNQATPFADGKPRVLAGVGGADRTISIRNLAFGRDIITLKRSRKLGGMKVPQIHVVSVDTSSKQRGASRLIEAWFPPQVADLSMGIDVNAATQARTTSVAPAGNIAQTDVLTISKPGIRSKKRLLQIAQNIYEEVGRGEVGGSCSTKDLASLGGDGADPDMLRLRPGDPVEFSVDNRQLASYPPAITEAAALYRNDPEQLAKVLAERLGDVNLSRVLAYSLTGRIAERQTIYRVNHARFAWDIEKGIGIDFDFQNYIESRAGITTLKTTANKRRPVSSK